MMIDFNYLFAKYHIKPYGVLHLGANTGQERHVYQMYDVKEVVWVEAIPEVFEQLQKNIEHFVGHTAMNVCVGDEHGKEVVFNVSNNEAQSSSYLDLDVHKRIHPEVHYVKQVKMKMERLDKIFSDFNGGDWFLNADLQGAELDAFKGLGDLLKQFKWVYTEVNKQSTYKDCPLIDDLDVYLLQHGFERVETGKWVADTWTDALYIKKYNF